MTPKKSALDLILTTNRLSWRDRALPDINLTGTLARVVRFEAYRFRVRKEVHLS